MSLATCQSCEAIIDTDEEPESCADTHFVCEVCREQTKDEEHEKVLSAWDMFKESMRTREIKRWRSK